MSWVGPGAIARLDAALIDRIRRGDRLGPVIASAIAVIALGAGAYGVAFGIWRAPEQALYSAIKLPLLFLGVGACTIVLSAMLAMLLRARLSLAQTTVCIALSFAICSVLLGALAPIAIWVDLHAPPPDPSALGLDEHDPRAAATMRVAQGLLLVHAFALACAGTAGVTRLRSLLLALGLARPVATRVMLSWIALQFLAGAQLSWLLRPFFGRPHMAPSWTVPEVLEGSFYEEIAVMAQATLGGAAPLVGLCALGAIALGLWSTLRGEVARVSARREEVGLVVLPGPNQALRARFAPIEDCISRRCERAPAPSRSPQTASCASAPPEHRAPGGAPSLDSGLGERVIPWRAIADARARGRDVWLTLAPDDALERERIVIACATAAAARDLEQAIDRERGRARVGPFRTASA